MIHHVIWDFDGTLFDTYPVMARAFREGLKALDCPGLPSIEEILAPMKITLGEAHRLFVSGRGLSEDDFEAVYRPLKARLEAELAAPFPEAKQLCRDVRAAGGKNYIFTHRSRSTLPMLDRFGMLGDFEEIVTTEDACFARKPSPDVINYLVEKHGMERGDAIMIGDREIDILSGCNAGIRSCLLAERGDVQTRADSLVTGFGELYGVLGIE